MTKTSNNNKLASKALPIIRARLTWKTIGGIIKTTTKNDNSHVAINTRPITRRTGNMIREAVNLSFKTKWAFARKLA